MNYRKLKTDKKLGVAEIIVEKAARNDEIMAQFRLDQDLINQVPTIELRNEELDFHGPRARHRIMRNYYKILNWKHQIRNPKQNQFLFRISLYGALPGIQLLDFNYLLHQYLLLLRAGVPVSGPVSL